MAARPVPISRAGMRQRFTTASRSVLSLPDDMRLFMCHDYGPNGRDIQWETTVAAEKEHNIHVGKGATKEQFVKFRTERDATLAMPKLIIPSLQVNMRAGEVPTDKRRPPDAQGAGQRPLALRPDPQITLIERSHAHGQHHATSPPISP
jgi:hypothetical protein